MTGDLPTKCTNWAHIVDNGANYRSRHFSIVCAKLGDTMPESWKFRGRPVRLVDGAIITLPDTPENQAQYPQPNSQEPGPGFPQCRLVGIICQASGALLDCESGPCVGKGSDEQTGLRVQLDVLEKDDILIGDAFYATYFLLAEPQRRQIDGVFEQNGARKRTTDFRRGRRLGNTDHVIELKKPKRKPDWMNQQEYEQAPDSIQMRECHVGGKTLTTAFLCAKSMLYSQVIKNLRLWIHRGHRQPIGARVQAPYSKWRFGSYTS